MSLPDAGRIFGEMELPGVGSMPPYEAGFSAGVVVVASPRGMVRAEGMPTAAAAVVVVVVVAVLVVVAAATTADSGSGVMAPCKTCWRAAGSPGAG